MIEGIGLHFIDRSLLPKVGTPAFTLAVDQSDPLSLGVAISDYAGAVSTITTVLTLDRTGAVITVTGNALNGAPVSVTDPRMKATLANVTGTMGALSIDAETADLASYTGTIKTTIEYGSTSISKTVSLTDIGISTVSFTYNGAGNDDDEITPYIEYITEDPLISTWNIGGVNYSTNTPIVDALTVSAGSGSVKTQSYGIDKLSMVECGLTSINTGSLPYVRAINLFDNGALTTISGATKSENLNTWDTSVTSVPTPANDVANFIIVDHSSLASLTTNSLGIQRIKVNDSDCASIILPATVDELREVNAANCKLTNVDTLVAKLAANSISNGILDISGQTPVLNVNDGDTACASIETLRGRGWTVTNDGTCQGVADTAAPTWPSGSVIDVTNTSSSVILAWSAAVDNVGVVGYRLYQDSVLLSDQTGRQHQASGLTDEQTYTFDVEAYDAAGNVSTTGPTVTVTAGAVQAGVVSVSSVTRSSYTGSAMLPKAYSLSNYRTPSNTTAPLNSAAAVIAAYNSASPGTDIVIKNGNYSNWNLVLGSQNDQDGATNGTAANPVHIRAETPGGVTLSASAFSFHNRHIIASGFDMAGSKSGKACFTVARSGIRISTNECLDGSSRHVSVEPDDGKQCHDMEVDSCTFIGNAVESMRIDSPSNNIPLRGWVHDNLFKDRPLGAYNRPAIWPGGSDENEMYLLLENNTFDNCVKDPDELLSIKAFRVWIKGAHIKNCGTSVITLRRSETSFVSGVLQQDGGKYPIRMFGKNNYVAFSYMKADRGLQNTGDDTLKSDGNYSYRVSRDNLVKTCFFEDLPDYRRILKANSGLAVPNGNVATTNTYLGGTPDNFPGNGFYNEASWESNNPNAKFSDQYALSGSGPTWNYPGGAELDLTPVTIPGVWDPLHKGNPSADVVLDVTEVPWWDSALTLS